MDSDRIEAKLDRLIAMYEARGDRIKELEKAVEAEARQRVKDCNERNAYKRELRLAESRIEALTADGIETLSAADRARFTGKETP